VTLPGGVRAKLGLALGVVVAVALAMVYAIVVPQLERNLVDQKLQELTRLAGSVTRVAPPGAPQELQDYVVHASETVQARVLFLEPSDVEGTPLPFRVRADSRQQQRSTDVAHDSVAVEAWQTGERAEGIVERGDHRFAQVAIPVEAPPGVVLFSTSLDDTLASVRLVQRQLLVAGAIALVVALLLGYTAATVFARRLRRLERAADRIAAGQLDEPVTDPGKDEVAELADAFEHMRVQLAGLERARREFVANASHELRTPIFALGGFLELLASEDLDEETRTEFVASMEEQVERLTRLAADLLDLSRLDAGQLSLERAPVDVAALAETLRQEFAPRARSSGHVLEAAVVEPVPMPLTDGGRMHRIGRALVENALRHTPGGTTVRIVAGGEERGAVLAVEDDGPGIPVEHRERVFERFYRVDGRRASGSGLGLAIARELARLMEGTLELDAVPGRTTFRLVVPARPARMPEREAVVS
jgi:signal transduction histidine kinase